MLHQVYKCTISENIDNIDQIELQDNLNNCQKSSNFSKVTSCSTRPNSTANFTNRCLNQTQNKSVRFHLSQVNIQRDEQWQSRGQSVSQFDHVFANTLLCMHEHPQLSDCSKSIAGSAVADLKYY